jgi:adenylate kinase family enzyme
MMVYEEKIGPLLEWYARKGLLIRVPAYGTPDEIYARTWTCGRSLRAPVPA